MAKAQENYDQQANWLSKFYPGNAKATNLDLFNWGLAHYLSEDYVKADTVFSMYAEKYPEQSFGYYWKAKSKALQDSGMLQGLAVPTYKKLIEVLSADSADANYKKWMVESLNYLAAYEANVKKDYAASVEYFKKVLEVEPGNKDAAQYIEVLEKSLNQQRSQ